MHGGGSVVVGQDGAESGCGTVFVAALQLVDLWRGDGCGVLVVGFVVEFLVEVGVVGVAASGHGDVGHGAGGAFAEQGVAGVGGDALGGVHGGGVAQGDVLGEVVAVEDGAGTVGQTFCGKPLGGGVDARDAPAVAVANLIQ